MEAPSVRGKVAIVTGGSRGIGFAIGVALAREGASVALAARGQPDLDAAVRSLRAEPGAGSVIGVATDVRDEEACAALVDRAAGELGGVDILIANAGVGRFGPVENLASEDWRQVIETNLNGVFYLSKLVIPHMKQAGGGWIITIGSLAGRNPFPGGAAYNASKFGLLGFTEALMQDVRYDGIRVSTVMPGSVATDFRGAGDGGESWKVWPEDIGHIVVDLVRFPDRALPSRVEVRPSRPPRK